jgi:hypothetical protein
MESAMPLEVSNLTKSRREVLTITSFVRRTPAPARLLATLED